ncbi:hypothetical protein N8516_04795 [Candidatus Thioglobus sp.]|nr:hypothetical protein [Candidatus Thioglobus sp.]
MSYFIPHAKREDLKRKTVYDFETQFLLVGAIEKRLTSEIIETIPLWEDLFSMGFEKGKDDWEFDQWRDVYVKHGWNEVKGEPRLKNDITIEESDQANWIKKGVLPDKRSEKWTEFTKEIDGVSYRRSFPDDKQKFWAWHILNHDKASFKKRHYLVRDASFDLDCLELYSEIHLHEAFLIMLGISPDDMDRKEFFSWMLSMDLISMTEAPIPEKLKTKFEDFKEWSILKRRFGKGKKVEKVSIENGKATLDTIEIDTKEFIEWALKNDIIEEDTAHFRDGRKAPYDESFSKMLHKELLAKYLIRDGKHHHEWIWNTTVGNGFNSFNYLGRLLALNMLPMKYWLPLDRNSVSWENLEHYIVGVKNPKNQISIPNNARVIEDIVKKLMEEHDKRPLTEYKDLD